MKKSILLLLIATTVSIASKAIVHVVQVANYQFTPADVPDVFVGDTMRWVWVSGSHTTTNDPANEPGNVLPAGAPSWSSPINSASPTFNYKVTVAGEYHYWCIPHSPNMAASFTVSNALPIKLTSFIVNVSNGKALVSWKTATEQNTDYFSVRRSSDGSAYDEVARIPAAGNSIAENSYSFTDTHISNDQYYYYNLAIVDKDGNREFSETKMVKGEGALKHIVLSISPNPISSPGHLMMTFNAVKDGKMEVSVINNQGQLLIKTQMEAFTGVNNGHLHLGDLSPGIYTLICILDGIRETHQLVFK